MRVLRPMIAADRIFVFASVSLGWLLQQATHRVELMLIVVAVAVAAAV